MRFRYKNNLPIVPVRLLGKMVHELEAHIDFAASRTIVPSYLAEEMQLEISGYVDVATASGVISMPECRIIVEAFGEKHKLHVGCLELPEETPVKALIGRDILDKYKVCLDGKRREIEVSDP